jgi:hypothetical protein
MHLDELPFTLMMVATLGALIIVPIQYISAFIIWRQYPDLKPVRNYIAIASLIMILEFQVMCDIDDTDLWKLQHSILVVSALILGLYYIRICRRIASL